MRELTLAVTLSLYVATAHMKRDIDEFLLEDQRTLTKNYRARSSDDLDHYGYTVEGPEDGALPLIVDYANMIRNDIILLDNSVQTKTRKRGALDAEKSDFADNPECSCEVIKKIVDLGSDYFPRYVESRQCSARDACPPRRACRDAFYNITVLKKKRSTRESSDVQLPRALAAAWLGVRQQLRVGCVCRED